MHPLPVPSDDPGPPQALGDSALQSQTLESVASAVNYHAWLTDLALPHLGDDPIELGSGLGDYADRWLAGGVPHITVTEVDPGRLSVLRDRFASDSRVRVRLLDVLSTVPAQHSAFVAMNVLEHIPDDVGALRGARRMVRPGGHVVVFVPAFDFAMSRFDHAVGHVRRYTRAGLHRVLESAGLLVEEVRYVNVPGLLAWWVGMRLLRMTPGDGPLLRVWDRVVVPLTRSLEERFGAPFGQSVFAVARVPGA
jgi:SAM-dependent methyltransferase